MKKLLLAFLSIVTLTSCSFLPSFPISQPTSSPTSEPTSTPTSTPTTVDPTTVPSVDPTTSTPGVEMFEFKVYGTQGGTWEGTKSGTYAKDTQISLTATPDTGYLFDGYFINDLRVEHDLTYTFNLVEDVNLEIRFAPELVGEYYYQSYSHVLKGSDIPNSSGGTTNNINGLTWDYTSYTYKQDSTKGVQIGSSNRPQTTAFSLHATFPGEVEITSAYVEVSVGSGGSSTFQIKFSGKNYYSSKFSKTDIETFSYEDLSIPATSITFAFTSSAKALYVYSFGFSVKVHKDIDLNLSGDSDIQVDPVVPGQNGVPSVNYQPITKDEYYKGIDTTATGDTLLTSLRTLISDMTSTSYDQARYMLQYTDENPEKEGYLYGMYDGDNIVAEWIGGSTWNREHVWPCAKMVIGDEVRPSGSTRNHTSDLHNLRAACPTVNGYHSDKYYSNTNTSTTMFPNVTSGITGKHEFTGDFRGDVARIMFYMYTRYDGLELTDDIDNANNKSMGELSLFIEWNELDPVDNFEIQRNERIYAYQGNRNPFIDYPNLVDNLFN